jgi:chromosome segregation ATPase
VDWLRQHMRDHMASLGSNGPKSNIVNLRQGPARTTEDSTAAILHLVHEAAELLRSEESRAAEIEARARALSERAIAELKRAEGQIQALESDCHRLKETVDQANDRALAAEEALKQSEACIATIEAQIAVVELRANESDGRARAAKAAIASIEHTIRDEILARRKSAPSESAVAA